jgi:WD40 repeat protein
MPSRRLLALLAVLLLTACGVQTETDVLLVGPTTIPYTATPIPPTATPTPIPIIQVATAIRPAQAPAIGLGNAGSVRPQRTYAGHNDSRVFGVAFSPDGRMIASAGHDGLVRLWETATGAELMAFSDHLDRVFSVAFSPDGSAIASGGNDSTVRLWEVPTDGGFRNVALAILGSPGDRVINTVTFSPNGQALLAGGRDVRAEDKTIHSLWELPPLDGPADPLAFRLRGGTTYTERPLSGHTDAILSSAFHPDGASFVTGSYDATIRQWTPGSATPDAIWTEAETWITGLAFAPSGGLLAAALHDGTITVSTFPDGDIRQTIDAGQAVWDVAFNPAGTILAAACADGTIQLWEAASGDLRAELRGHSATVRAVAFSTDGGWIVSGSDDGSVRLWGIDS